MRNICLLIGLFLLYPFRIIQSIYCPLNCNCEDVSEAKCNNGSKFPHGFNHTLLALSVSNIKIKHLSKQTIGNDNLCKLLNLTITSCQIQLIDNNVFYELPALQYLDLSYNYIKDFNIDIFKNNTLLNILVLDSNPLQIRRDVFLRLPTLKELSLANCTISEIPKTFFDELPNLRVLNLTDNNLKFLSVYTFKNLNKLQKVDLRRNKWYCDVTLYPLISWYLTMHSTSEIQVYCTFPESKLWHTDLLNLIYKNTYLRKEENRVPKHSVNVIDKNNNKLHDKTKTSRNSQLSTLEIILLVIAICSVIVTALVVWLAIFKFRQYRSQQDILDKVPYEQGIQPVNICSEVINTNEMIPLNIETYIENRSSAATSQGYLVPRTTSDDHVYEEIE